MMKVVNVDSILSSIKAIRESGMGKRASLDEIKELIILNSFEIEEKDDGNDKA